MSLERPDDTFNELEPRLQRLLVLEQKNAKKIETAKISIRSCTKHGGLGYGLPLAKAI